MDTLCLHLPVSFKMFSIQSVLKLVFSVGFANGFLLWKSSVCFWVFHRSLLCQWVLQHCCSFEFEPQPLSPPLHICKLTASNVNRTQISVSSQDLSSRSPLGQQTLCQSNLKCKHFSNNTHSSISRWFLLRVLSLSPLSTLNWRDQTRKLTHF